MSKTYTKTIYGPSEILVDPINGNKIVGSRVLGVREALTKKSIRELNDKYGVMYHSAIAIIQALDPITAICVFHVLCMYTQIETNRIMCEPKDVMKTSGISKATYYRSIGRLKKINIVMEIDGAEYMNPLVFSMMSKESRFAFYKEHDCTMVVGPEDFRKNCM